MQRGSAGVFVVFTPAEQRASGRMEGVMRSAAAVLSGGQASQRYSRARTSLDEVSWPLPPGSKPAVGQSEMCSDRAEAVEAVVCLRGVLRRKCLHPGRCWRSDAAGDAESCRARAE